MVMVAVSQAPSPESNPNPPLPVRGKVVHYTTFYLIGGEFVQHRTKWRFRYIGLRQQLHLPVRALVLVPANSILDPTFRFPRKWLGGQEFVVQVLAARLGQLSRRKARMPPLLGRLLTV